MNLEELNLVELNAQEVVAVDGGCINCTPLPGLWSGIKFLVGVGVAMAQVSAQQNITNHGQ